MAISAPLVRMGDQGSASEDNRFTMSRAGEMCINWVTFLKSKRKFRLRSVTLCELATIAGLEQP